MARHHGNGHQPIQCSSNGWNSEKIREHQHRFLYCRTQHEYRWNVGSPCFQPIRNCKTSDLGIFLPRFTQCTCMVLVVSIFWVLLYMPLGTGTHRSEEHTSELQSLTNLVCRLLLE